MPYRDGAVSPFISIRLWPRHHDIPHDVEELLEALSANKAACDEVWFCTAWGFPPLSVHAEHALAIAKVMPRFRELGIATGIQLANTLGHGHSPLFPQEAADWPLMVDEFGKTERPGPCPRSEEIHRYIAEVSRLYGVSQPSSFWIDDDLRMNYHGIVKNACFCEVCLGEFSREQERPFTRELLYAELHHSDRGALRLAWTNFNARSLASITRTVARACHAVSPGTQMAFQQLEHENFMYSGPDWKPLYDALYEESGSPTGARLGNGFYTDHQPRQMINKAFYIGRQVSRLPASVQRICPEVENFTHNAYGKTANGTVVESSLYLAMGCNSLSFAILCSDHEPGSFHAGLLSRIGHYRNFWKGYLEASGQSTPGGVQIVLGKNHVTRQLNPDEVPFSWIRADMDRLYQLAGLGIPFTSSENPSPAYFLDEVACVGLSDIEVTTILESGVMMNGATAWHLQERGFGEWLGVRLSRIEPVDVYERISSNEQDGGKAGRRWMLWLDSWHPAFLLEPLDSSVRAIGHYEKRTGEAAGIATSLYENSKGGRVAIFGYFDWAPNASASRRDQYLAAADWISKSRLPVLVHNHVQVVVIPRVNAAGQTTSLFLLNVSIDLVPTIDFTVRSPRGDSARWVQPGEQPVALAPLEAGLENRYVTPPLPAWSCAYIEFLDQENQR